MNEFAKLFCEEDDKSAFLTMKRRIYRHLNRHPHLGYKVTGHGRNGEWRIPQESLPSFEHYLYKPTKISRKPSQISFTPEITNRLARLAYGQKSALAEFGVKIFLSLTEDDNIAARADDLREYAEYRNIPLETIRTKVETLASELERE